MWRTFFIAGGVALCIMGAECMVVDRFVLSGLRQEMGPFMTTEEYTSWESDLPTTAERRVLVPPEWAPWGLLSAGVMVVLYSASFQSGGSGDE